MPVDVITPAEEDRHWICKHKNILFRQFNYPEMQLKMLSIFKNLTVIIKFFQKGFFETVIK